MAEAARWKATVAEVTTADDNDDSDCGDGGDGGRGGSGKWQRESGGGSSGSSGGGGKAEVEEAGMQRHRQPQSRSSEGEGALQPVRRLASRAPFRCVRASRALCFLARHTLIAPPPPSAVIAGPMVESIPSGGECKTILRTGKSTKPAGDEEGCGRVQEPRREERRGGGGGSHERSP